PARLDRRGQRDADGVQGDRNPYEGLLRSAEFHAQALDGPGKGFLPQKPLDCGMQFFKITQVHGTLSAAERKRPAGRGRLLRQLPWNAVSAAAAGCRVLVGGADLQGRRPPNSSA